jgi:tRNA-Thr(GGU) m(6)t(6)A37 methyltransferase TsaA
VGLALEEVFVAVQGAHPFERLTRSEIWRSAEDMDEVLLKPIGVVDASRKTPEDDHWGGEVSTIELDTTRFTEEAVAGLKDFSHIEVVFLMHLVPDGKIEVGARHPRNRQDWPLVGIFAQRAKGRPNRLGVSRCRLLKVDGLKLTVVGLDAIKGTPVLDIKPYMVEFGPRGEVVQPAWATEVMKEYY